MRVRPRFCRCCRLVPIVTFDTGLLTRLSYQVRPHRDVGRRRDVDAELAADQTLGAELIVRPRDDRPDRELAIQLVERRRAEPQPEVAPHAHLVGQVVQRRRRAG